MLNIFMFLCLICALFVSFCIIKLFIQCARDVVSCLNNWRTEHQATRQSDMFLNENIGIAIGNIENRLIKRINID